MQILMGRQKKRAEINFTFDYFPKKGSNILQSSEFNLSLKQQDIPA